MKRVFERRTYIKTDKKGLQEIGSLLEYDLILSEGLPLSKETVFTDFNEMYCRVFAKDIRFLTTTKTFIRRRPAITISPLCYYEDAWLLTEKNFGKEVIIVEVYEEKFFSLSQLSRLLTAEQFFNYCASRFTKES